MNVTDNDVAKEKSVIARSSGGSEDGLHVTLRVQQSTHFLLTSVDCNCRRQIQRCMYDHFYLVHRLEGGGGGGVENIK